MVNYGLWSTFTRLRSPHQYAFYQLEMAMVIDNHRIWVVDITTLDYVFRHEGIKCSGCDDSVSE